MWHDDQAAPPNGCNDAVTLTILDPLGFVDWDFGLTTTGPGSWHGEDCFNGQDGTNLCHRVTAPSDCLEQVPTCNWDDVTESATTFFDASADPELTYYLADGTGACFVFGANPSYYQALGCTQMM